MADITSQKVLDIANLAQLKLTGSEVDKFSSQLSKILDHIDELKGVETSGVEPTAQTTGLVNVLREDKINEARSLTLDEALSGIDKTENGFFKVPVILTKNG